MIIWNLLDDGLSHNGPLLEPSKSMQGDTPSMNPRLLALIHIIHKRNT
jgi:hypothetical protein